MRRFNEARTNGLARAPFPSETANDPHVDQVKEIT